MTTPHFPTTLKAKGYRATSRPDGRWDVRGRGPRSVKTHEELMALLSAKPKRTNGPRRT